MLSYEYLKTICPMVSSIVGFEKIISQGVYLRELTKSVHWIIRELQALRADVGFCGQSEDVILYAQDLLGKHLISKKWYVDFLF